jgi:hypothetical protein
MSGDNVCGGGGVHWDTLNKFLLKEEMGVKMHTQEVSWC